MEIDSLSKLPHIPPLTKIREEDDNNSVVVVGFNLLLCGCYTGDACSNLVGFSILGKMVLLGIIVRFVL